MQRDWETLMEALLREWRATWEVGDIVLGDVVTSDNNGDQNVWSVSVSDYPS